MATILRLVQGATTVDLNDGTTTKMSDKYTPAEGGGRIPVTESVKINVIGANVAAVEATISTISEMLRQGQERQVNPTITPVYVQFQPDGAAALWRSELLDYRTMLPEDAYTELYYNGVVELTISWTRRGYWEANSETQLSLTNGNGTNNTSGLRVYGYNDGTGSSPNEKDNYVSISSASVTGDLPGAVRLEITNEYSDGTDRVDQVYVGQSCYVTDYANLPWALEFEDASDNSGLITEVTSAAGSNGKYADIGPIIANGYTSIWWNLTASQAAALRGGYYKLVMRRPINKPTGLENVRVRVTVNASEGSGGITLSDKYLTGYDALYDIGTVRLPPYLPGLTGLGGCQIMVTFYNTNAASITIPADFLALLPCDNYRFYSVSLATGYRLIDDGVNGVVYQDTGSSAAVGISRIDGAPITVQPGKTQRLWFLFDINSTTPALGISATVKAYYRPRRSHL